ncbi:cobalt/nickel transport protein [Hathewaya proteolytica DSM 3090]|uniref:Cobalt transport protein CbiN n=1 Tax=Hathewaya proteolytica DSM 3090 TaxID=1121331 RepID=A0A1M6QE37_9CLOT|nr:energy-coupling factor ABC transporter substrate-binding protein [Hathewaya proteolytica]SHK18438.1 cobalt/nickel transport protein [Hathewaya proteolytica DSM 3090]
MSKKNVIGIILALLICAVILVVPLMTIKDSDFGGADDKAEDVIAKVNPGYEPWQESVIELPGGETESLLFCLQAALGAGVVGYGFGYYVSRKKYSSKGKNENKNEK